MRGPAATQAIVISKSLKLPKERGEGGGGGGGLQNSEEEEMAWKSREEGDIGAKM